MAGRRTTSDDGASARVTQRVRTFPSERKAHSTLLRASSFFRLAALLHYGGQTSLSVRCPLSAYPLAPVLSDKSILAQVYYDVKGILADLGKNRRIGFSLPTSPVTARPLLGLRRGLPKGAFAKGLSAVTENWLPQMLSGRCFRTVRTVPVRTTPLDSRVSTLLG